MYSSTTDSWVFKQAQKCTANISVKRNRVKVYPATSMSTLDHKVYLQDKQEFEIELYNPTSRTKLAKISMNGKPISRAGIVIKPGQRIHLERYLDTPNKFRFETYHVEDNWETQTVIVDNGFVQVDFYDEYTPVVYDQIWSGISGQSGLGFSGTHTFTSSTNPPLRSAKGGQHVNSLSSRKETGRIEQGSGSDQSFTNYQGSFLSSTESSVKIKILPWSEKPAEAQELAQYCTSCGTKNKKGNYKYCPKCGTQF